MILSWRASMRFDRPTALGGQLRLCVLSLLGILLFAGTGAAQKVQGTGLPKPRLLQVSPCGGKVGTSFEVTVTGQDIEDAEQLLFSQPGIKAEVVQAAA